MKTKRLWILAVMSLLIASAQAQHSVTLQGCTDTTPGVQFNFYRGTTAGGESTTPLNAAPQTLCFWSDTTVNGNSTYYYVAKAYCASCSPTLSGPSNEVRAVVPADAQPAAPTGLTLGTVAQNSVPLFWTPPAMQSSYENVAFYVMRSPYSNMSQQTRIDIEPSWLPNYTDKSCTGTCYYAIRAYDIGPTGNSFVTSKNSNIVKAVD